ncbi:MAG: VWA domain-containing protein [Bacteroidota bacterium]|nr:VWA domain-containing protein [Bacteroidota bacterium]
MSFECLMSYIRNKKNMFEKNIFALVHHTLCICILLLSLSVFAQPRGVKITKNTNNEKTKILFIVDSSYNMYEKWQSDSKIKITQNLVSNIIDTLSLQEGVECALRVFGSEKDYSLTDCEDTRLLVPFYRLNSDALKSKIKGLVPKGTSAVGSAMEKIKDDFPAEKSSRNIVIMILNNVERCGGDLALISQQLQTQGVILKPFIIGINRGMKNFYQNVGSYYEANNEVEFSKIMNDIVKQALYNTSAQVNLLDSYMETTETNIPITFSDAKSKQTRYSFVHTFNQKGISDTIFIDPLTEYDIVVHTIPPTRQDNVKIVAGSHTIVPIKAPQGSLLIKFTSDKNDLNIKSYPVIVRKTREKQTINLQNINQKEKYLVGNYDLEVLSLPRLNIDSVEIGQSSLTTVEIPLAGVLSLDKVKSNITGALFVKEKENLIWVCNLNNEKVKENIELLPGVYVVVAKQTNATKTTESITQEIKIESNKITNVTLFAKKKK